jgi:hypothetical protein
LRNVTWVLQKEHAAVPGFEPWYAGWLERMKADPLMKWLVDARNQVVKRGDLETRSTARALIRSYGAIAVTEFTAPPFVPADVIAADLAEFGIPPLREVVRNASILVVERRWLAKDLPDHELLEALAHCYGILSIIVAEAHERAGFRFTVCDVSQPDLELPRFRGHRSQVWDIGVHDAEISSSVSTGIPTTSGRARAGRALAGIARAAV